MLQIGGIVVLFACVFGGYLMTGGSLAVVIEAAPHELLTIFGAAIAAMLIAGSMYNMKKIAGSLGKVISGPKWKPKDYNDLLCLLFLLTKTMKSKGLIALEAHIEKPSDSSIFKRYPKICKDHFALDFICDTLRMMTMSLEDPHQVENAMEKQLEKHHHEALVGANALQTMADGLPALGIVAAVLGVIKTMGAITEPPEVLGGMIGSALVGTFLGVFLAYGIVGPLGDPAESGNRRGCAVLSRHPRHTGGASARQCGPGVGGNRPRQRAQRISAQLPGAGKRAEQYSPGYGLNAAISRRYSRSRHLARNASWASDSETKNTASAPANTPSGTA